MNSSNARFYREEEIRRERSRRPFYADSFPCESCGEPCDERTLDPDSELYIGTGCSCTATPDEPVCLALYQIYVEASGTLRELNQNVLSHRLKCSVCRGRKGPGSQPAAQNAAGEAA